MFTEVQGEPYAADFVSRNIQPSLYYMVFYSRSIADDGKLPETHRRPGPARETPDGQKMSELQGHVGRLRGISDSDRQSKTNSTY